MNVLDKKLLSSILIIVLALIGTLFSAGIMADDPNDVNATNGSVHVSEDGRYVTAPEVAAYIKQYHKLPSNYITKKEAQSLGWQGGPLKSYAPGKSIGGDVFTNRQGILPAIGSKYIECDIDANGTSRGAKRIVYSAEDYRVYYTDNHYESFKEI